MKLKFGLLPVILVVHTLTGSVQACNTNRIVNKEYNAYTTKAEQEKTYCMQREVKYVAAVLEYTPSQDGPAREVLQTNAETFAEYAAQAKLQNADIMVFPEYGLTGIDMPSSTKGLLSFSLIVPDPSHAIVPCDYPSDQPYTQALSMLSCTAGNLSLYLVIDLTEQVDCSSDDCPDGYYFYNTQVVLDRQGAIVARYRKQHLFYEFGYTSGNEDPETAIFTTDFGVTFTLQICFDIMWDSPGVLNVVNHGIRDVIMSTAWVDELPHLTAPQHFSGWSVGLGVNFLVSGLHRPTHGQLGSGIFFGVTGDDPLYVWDATLGNELLVHIVSTNNFEKSDLIKESQRSKSSTNNRRDKTRNFFENMDEPLLPSDQIIIHEDLSNYTNVVLSKSEHDIILIQTACHNDLICCTVTYVWPEDDTENGSYLLLAYSGEVSKMGMYTMYVEVCSVVYCLSPNIGDCTKVEDLVPSQNSFGVLSLNGNFNTKYVYPSVLTQDMQLYNKTLWTFGEENKDERKYLRSIRFQSNKSVSNLLSLTMLGRWFEKDGN